jgi:hypothetical protein
MKKAEMVYYRNLLIHYPIEIVIYYSINISIDVIKVVWSPHMCLVERKRNTNDILNTKLDPHERAVTFEGKDYMCETIKLSNP